VENSNKKKKLSISFKNYRPTKLQKTAMAVVGAALLCSLGVLLFSIFGNESELRPIKPDKGVELQLPDKNNSDANENSEPSAEPSTVPGVEPEVPAVTSEPASEPVAVPDYPQKNEAPKFDKNGNPVFSYADQPANAGEGKQNSDSEDESNKESGSGDGTEEQNSNFSDEHGSGDYVDFAGYDYETAKADEFEILSTAVADEYSVSKLVSENIAVGPSDDQLLLPPGVFSFVNMAWTEHDQNRGSYYIGLDKVSKNEDGKTRIDYCEGHYVEGFVYNMGSESEPSYVVGCEVREGLFAAGGEAVSHEEYVRYLENCVKAKEELFASESTPALLENLAYFAFNDRQTVAFYTKRSDDSFKQYVVFRRHFDFSQIREKDGLLYVPGKEKGGVPIVKSSTQEYNVSSLKWSDVGITFEAFMPYGYVPASASDVLGLLSQYSWEENWVHNTN